MKYPHVEQHFVEVRENAKHILKLIDALIFFQIDQHEMAEMFGDDYPQAILLRRYLEVTPTETYRELKIKSVADHKRIWGRFDAGFGHACTLIPMERQSLLDGSVAVVDRRIVIHAKECTYRIFAYWVTLLNFRERIRNHWFQKTPTNYIRATCEYVHSPVPDFHRLPSIGKMPKAELETYKA